MLYHTMLKGPTFFTKPLILGIGASEIIPKPLIRCSENLSSQGSHICTYNYIDIYIYIYIYVWF